MTEVQFLLPDHTHLDEMVAIREERKWQRGILTQIQGMAVALRDWRRIIKRPSFEIYILEEKFRELKKQAIPCVLTLDLSP